MLGTSKSIRTTKLPSSAPARSTGSTSTPTRPVGSADSLERRATSTAASDARTGATSGIATQSRTATPSKRAISTTLPGKARPSAPTPTKPAPTSPQQRAEVKEQLRTQAKELETSFAAQNTAREKLEQTVSTVNAERLAAWREDVQILRRTGERDLPQRPEPLTMDDLDRLAVTTSYSKGSGIGAIAGAARSGAAGADRAGASSGAKPALGSSSSDDHSLGPSAPTVVATPTSLDELLAMRQVRLTSAQRQQLETSFTPYVAATSTVVEKSTALQRTARSHPDMVEEIGREHMQRAQEFFAAHGLDEAAGNGAANVTSWDEDGYRNASYRPSDDTFRFGRIGGTPLATSGDVVIHEYAHRIFSHAGLSVGSAEAGAISESFSDVIAVVLDPGDWRVGEDAVTNGVRQFDHLNTTTLSSIPHREAHDLAAVPNAAAYRIAQATSRADMGEIYVKAVGTYLSGTPTFTDMARATWRAAVDLYGAQSTQAAAVRDAWTAVLELKPGTDLFSNQSNTPGSNSRAR